MLRSFFIYLSKAGWARKIVMNWSFTKRMASRFISGEGLDDAIRAIHDLNKKNINATLDHLGEHTASRGKAELATLDILNTLDEIDR